MGGRPSARKIAGVIGSTPGPRDRVRWSARSLPRSAASRRSSGVVAVGGRFSARWGLGEAQPVVPRLCASLARTAGTFDAA